LRGFIVPFLLLSLSLQQGLFSLTSAVLTSKLALNAAAELSLLTGKEVMLLCRGNRFVWVDESEYFASGKLIEVDISAHLFSDSPETSHSNEYATPDCAWSFYGLIDILLFSVPHWHVPPETDWPGFQHLLLRPFTAYPFKTALSRAPPVTHMVNVFLL